jgi:hypothetical protein
MSGKEDCSSIDYNAKNGVCGRRGKFTAVCAKACSAWKMPRKSEKKYIDKIFLFIYRPIRKFAVEDILFSFPAFKSLGKASFGAHVARICKTS